VRGREVDAELLAVERVFGGNEMHWQVVPRDDLAGREQDALGVGLVVAMRLEIARCGDSHHALELVSEARAGSRTQLVDHLAGSQATVIDDAAIAQLDR